MKVSTILFVVYLFGMRFVAPQICKTNPFIYQLKLQGVVFLENPQKGSNSCGIEWQTHGYCCDVPSLVQYSKRDRLNITAAVNGLLIDLHQLSQNHTRMLSVANHFDKSDIDMISSPVNQRVVKFLKSQPSINFGNRLKQILGHGQLPVQLRTCWEKMAASRSSSLCSVCSARSLTFFEGKNILIDVTDCKNIISDCVPAFEQMIDTIEALGSFFEKLIEFLDPKDEDTANFREGMAYMAKLTQIIKSQHLQASIQKYLGLSESEKVPQAARLCSIFLKIQGKTQIEILKDFINKYSFVRIEASLGYANKNRIERAEHTIQAGQRSSRKLTEKNIAELPQFDTFFSGDVTPVLKNTDNSYSSFFGADGTTVTSHVGGKPFNITNKFP